MQEKCRYEWISGPHEFILVKVKKALKKAQSTRDQISIHKKDSLSWVSSYFELRDSSHLFKDTGNSESQTKAPFTLKDLKICMWVDKN